MTDAAQVVALVFAGLLVGNEFGTWAVVHRSLARLPTPQHVAAEQALNRGYGVLMPPLMVLTIAACAIMASLLPEGAGSAPWTLTVSALSAFTLMLAITLLGNSPLNARTNRTPLDVDRTRWLALRQRWHRLHTVRVMLDLAGLTLLAAGLVARA